MGGHDLATLSAVAEFVVHLSIGARNQQIYGVDHPTARRGFEKMDRSLRRALELCHPLELHFTPEAIFCGVQCLERGHPIYRRFADRMWRLGVVGLSFERGLQVPDLVQFLTIVNRSRAENWSRRRTEQELRGSQLPHLRLEFLHELMTYEASEEVRQVSKAEQEKLWEGFMAQLARFRALGPLPEGAEPLTSPTEGEQADPQSEEEYAEAVIEYLKRLERSKQQDALLAQTDFGQKVATFLQDVNPNLRHQIMSSAIRSPEVSAETLQRLVGLVGHDQLVESLQRLNRSGSSIPPTAFRALSLLSMVRGEETLTLDHSAHRSPEDASDVQRLLDGLMAADRASTYTSPEYERTIQNIQSHAQRLVQDVSTAQFALTLSPNEAEKHFLLAAGQILEDNSEDAEMASHVQSEAESSYTYFIEAGVPSLCRQSMQLARQARALSGELSQGPFVWETEEVLGPLTEQLAGSDRWQSEDSGYLLTTIGTAAVPSLIEILQTSEKISARKRAIASLVTMQDDPAPLLLPLLSPRQPWYVQRNVVGILRQRNDTSGLEAAKRCWRTRKRRLQLEILAYLLACGDPNGCDYLWQALHHPDGRMVLEVLRVAIKTPRNDVVETIEQRIDGLSSLMVGTRYHVSMLRLLARCESPRARRYVERARHGRQPLFTWMQRRFQEQLDDLLHE